MAKETLVALALTRGGICAGWGYPLESLIGPRPELFNLPSPFRNIRWNLSLPGVVMDTKRTGDPRGQR